MLKHFEKQKEAIQLENLIGTLRQNYFLGPTFQVAECDCCFDVGLIHYDDSVCVGRHNWICETCDGDKTVTCVTYGHTSATQPTYQSRP